MKAKLKFCFNLLFYGTFDSWGFDKIQSTAPFEKPGFIIWSQIGN